MRPCSRGKPRDCTLKEKERETALFARKRSYNATEKYKKAREKHNPTKQAYSTRLSLQAPAP